MATVQDRTHAVNGLNDPQQGACSGPEAPAHAPCSAGRDADLCHSEICRASNGKENTMRAVTVTEYGATPAVAEMPTPVPGPRQVLIRLRAAGMNPMDRALASGAWKPMPATFPMVLGVDGAGVVEQSGPGASKVSVGAFKPRCPTPPARSPSPAHRNRPDRTAARQAAAPSPPMLRHRAAPDGPCPRPGLRHSPMA